MTQTFNLTAFKSVIAQMVFNNSATAGNNTLFAVSGPGALASMLFIGTSNAGSANVTPTGGTDVQGSYVDFGETSSAGTAVITSQGGRANGAQGGGVAGALGGGVVFSNSASAANATLIADGRLASAIGGAIAFAGAATGGSARVQLSGTGSLAIDTLTQGLSIGSLEGSGSVSLGANNLTVGGTNQNMTFSGVISGLTGRPGGTLPRLEPAVLFSPKAALFPAERTSSAASWW